MVKKLHVLNVWQGSTSLQELSNGQIVLVDYNQLDDENSLNIIDYIKDNLPSTDWKWTIDYLFITHPDLDHIKGLKNLFDDSEIEVLKIYHSWYEKDVSEDDPNYQDFKNYQDIVKENDSVVFKAQSESILDFDWIKIYCFGPSGNEKKEDDVHDRCWIIKIDDNWYTVMYPWDSSFSQRKDRVVPYYWTDKDNMLESNILLASHHGSRSFFMTNEWDDPYKDWLNKINPQKCVISAWEDNQHDHPHDDALKIYEEKVWKDNVYITYNEEKSVVLDLDTDFSKKSQTTVSSPYFTTPVTPQKPRCNL